jgi:hypothetical protein
MKTLSIIIASLALAASAFAQQLHPETWAIKGKVLSVTADGVLVMCADNPAIGKQKPKADEIIFLRGNFKGAHDAQGVNVTAYPTDKTFEYNAVSGAAKTVQVFALDLSPPVKW